MKRALLLLALGACAAPPGPPPPAPWPPPTGPLRVVIDADAANEIDDQYALALALGFPDRIRLVGEFEVRARDRGGTFVRVVSWRRRPSSCGCI